MTIPVNKEDIPDWVNWIAQDADGCIWGYEAEPHIFDRGWYENEVGRAVKLSLITNSACWKGSLRKLNHIF